MVTGRLVEIGWLRKEFVRRKHINERMIRAKIGEEHAGQREQNVQRPESRKEHGMVRS